jgi:hypothetical protein
MSIEIPDRLDHIELEDVARVAVQAWYDLWQERPSHAALCLLLGQSALETGWWRRGLHCWNFGNAKSVEGDGHDFTHFGCDEIIGGRRVVFRPEVPSERRYCRFRAFATARDGMRDHLVMLRRRFAHSWAALCTGDPIEYSRALYEQHYYTADPRDYAARVRSCTATVRERLSRAGIDASTVDVELTPEERERLVAMLGLSLKEQTAP